ncbi:MAG TPA: isopentenyl-diphosphate Delta-isomerase, partial [Abditibacterium sp.]
MKLETTSQHRNRDQVVLVNERDETLGAQSKLEAHQNGGVLHRAFSIFIFDCDGRMLLQRRADSKYHFAGLWTNACCSHPQPGEALEAAVHARLCDEFGFDVPLREVFSFVYHAHDAQSGLTEREFDHVFIGEFGGEPQPNPHEIGDWKWLSFEAVRADLAA